MDGDAIIDELEDHGFDSFSAERLLAVVNDAYWDACGREPWPFLQKSIVLTFNGSSGVPTNWPSDYRAATALGVTAGTGTTTTGKVRYIRYDDWLEQYGSNPQTGIAPAVMYNVGSTYTFYPTPGSGYQVTMQYVCQPAALAADSLESAILIPVAFHRSVIVNGALFKLYAMDDDTDIAPTFETYYERGLQNMREYCWRNQYVSQDIIHPVDLEDLGLDFNFGYTGDGA